MTRSPGMKKSEGEEQRGPGIAQKPFQGAMAVSLSMFLHPGKECMSATRPLIRVQHRPWRAWASSGSSLHPRWLARSLAHAGNPVQVLLFQSPPLPLLYCAWEPESPRVPQQTTLSALHLEAAAVSLHPTPVPHSPGRRHVGEAQKCFLDWTYSSFGRFLWSSGLGFAVPPWPWEGDILFPMPDSLHPKSQPLSQDLDRGRKVAGLSFGCL